MSKKSNTAREIKRKKEDVRFFRMTGMFFLACAVILFILRIVYARGTESFALSFWRLCNSPVYIGITALLFALSALYFIVKKLVKKKNESMSYLPSSYVLAMGAYLFGASYFFGHANNPDLPLLTGTVMLVVLFYVYHFYRIDFFAFSVQCAVSVIAVWAIASKAQPAFVAMKIALILVSFAYSYRIFKISGRINNTSCNKMARHSLCSWPLFVLTALLAVLLFARQTTLLNLLILLVAYVASGVFYSIRLLKEI